MVQVLGRAKRGNTRGLVHAVRTKGQSDKRFSEGTRKPTVLAIVVVVVVAVLTREGFELGDFLCG